MNAELLYCPTCHYDAQIYCEVCNPMIIEQDILDIVNETIDEIEYWHSDMLSKEEREHPRGNGWARVYDKLQKINNELQKKEHEN